MRVGESVRLAIDSWGRGESEAAMLHACNAVDGTAAKLYPKKGNAARFTALLREQNDIFGLMAVRGVNTAETRWPVHVRSTLGKDEWPDTADLVYAVHRCYHGHGDEVPVEFALIADRSELHVERGSVRLPWNTIFGLLGVAVTDARNVGERVPDGYYLEWGQPPARFEVNEWWGRRDEFREVLTSVHTPLVTLNWAEWTERPPSLT